MTGAKKQNLWVLLTVLTSLSACGIVGDKGLAEFGVGRNWGKEHAIATGSVFQVTAWRSGVLWQGLQVSATTPAVQKQANGAFKAVAAGAAQFQASDAAGVAVDTVEYRVADPAAVSLGVVWNTVWDVPTELPTHFALVLNNRYVGAVIVREANAARMNHVGITQATFPGAQVKVLDDYVEATPTTLGTTTATVNALGLDGKVLATHAYQVDVVEASAVAHLTLASFALQTSATVPADPDKGPDAPATGTAPTAPKTQLFALTTVTTLADGTPVYGARAKWTESGTGHLVVKESDGGNYALLKSGESVTVHATVGTLDAEITLQVP